MYDIPKPQLLDPDRVHHDDRERFVARDHRTQAELLATALRESCSYADQLWEQVNALRGYLLDTVPPDPRSPGPHRNTSASPTGPDDETGWTNWINAFATTTSVLCGSHGDSGIGLVRARQEAQLRRTAPEPTLPACDPDCSAITSRPAEPRVQPAAADAGAGSRDTEDRATDPGMIAIAEGAVATAIAVLAIRGLRAPRTKADSRTQT